MRSINISHRLYTILSALAFVLSATSSVSQTIATSSIPSTEFCAGSALSVSYTITGTFLAGNFFTAQLSDATGSFTAPIDIGITVTLGEGTISAQIPFNQVAGSLYRIRVVSANPVIVGTPNDSDLVVMPLGIESPIFEGSSFCQEEIFAISYNVKNGCVFPNTPSNNVFIAQLSDASGSFASPTTIGFAATDNSGFITATIPVGTLFGTGYRIRIASSNAVTISDDNGIDLTVNVPSGNPAVFGTAAWNAYAYKGASPLLASNTFAGIYTENNLSFDTRDRWDESSGPSGANGSSGTAYSGCPVAGENYSMSFKRTNFTCGYYQFDIPDHDDAVRLYIDGNLVFDHAVCCDSHTNVWTGFLGPITEVEFQINNNFLLGFLKVIINPASNPLVVSDSPTICSTSNTILSVSAPLALTYSWSPLVSITPSNGLGGIVTAAPSVTTTYTVTGTDGMTGCDVSKSVDVNVVLPGVIPTVTVTSDPSTICSGSSVATLVASGANTYAWSPALGLSAITGSTVVADPSVTTNYSVVGSTGCQTSENNATVTVEAPPSSPATSAFGNNSWNVFCYSDIGLSNYAGFYTEDNLNFNTSTRWDDDLGPSTANATSGLPYAGCSFGGNFYALSFKRANFACDYYQIDIPYQDDALTLLIDGVQIYQNNSFEPGLQANVWTGFLGPTSTIEFRLVNLDLLGQLEISIFPSGLTPQMLSAAINICAGSNTEITSTSSIAAANHSWVILPIEPTITLLPNSIVSNPTFQTTGLTPAGDYTVTNTITDAAGTGCSKSASVIIKVDGPPNTMVTPTDITSSCPEGVTLTASGASTYSWSPATGLNATTGASVIAKPLDPTTYTVIGTNSCSSSLAMSTVTIEPIQSFTSFPIGTWNVYGFNSTVIGTSYQGYYSENGSGSSGLDFDTQVRWNSNSEPSSADGINGLAWQGCTMRSDNTSLSFKRTGFTCGMYQINVPAHQDDFILLINGVEMARHQGCCDDHTNIWTGVLNLNSTVEWQLQMINESSLKVSFTSLSQPSSTSIWSGSNSSDWFMADNWCNGVASPTVDVIIPSAGPQNMPVIEAANAVVRNITIGSAVAGISTGNLTTFDIPAAKLSINEHNLDVYGKWINNGVFVSNTNSVNFVGVNSDVTIAASGTQTFHDLTVNNPNGITVLSGTHQVSGNLTFVNGILFQNAKLEILTGGIVSNASNNSYVDGAISKMGSEPFTFPTGKSNLYRPITISAISNTSDVYEAEYFDADPNSSYPDKQLAETMDRISSKEYWLLKNTGVSNARVTLSWAANSETVDKLIALRVATLNGSAWIDLGNGATTGTSTSGTITTSAASSIQGPYTLAWLKETTVGLDEFHASKSGSMLYPNPSKGYVTINTDGREVKALTILDDQGREIDFKFSVELSKIMINTSLLASGIYFVNLVLDEEPSMMKFIVN